MDNNGTSKQSFINTDNDAYEIGARYLINDVGEWVKVIPKHWKDAFSK